MLRTQGLSYKVEDKFLIDNISLEFAPGILHGILGPNGSGKTTFLKTVTGIWHPTKGQVLWQDRHLLQQGRKYISRTISLVLQNHSIPFDFLVEDMVAMGLYSHEKTDPCLSRVEHALTAVDARHLRSRRMNCLSNGERQRVYIARALVTESPVILLDEPTTSLDIRHQLDIWSLLKKLALQGKTVIATIHDLHIAERFCDRIAVFNQGHCIGTGAFSEIMQPPLLKEVFGVAESSVPLRKHYT